MTALRLVAFGDLATWGACWIPEAGAAAPLAARRGSAADVRDVVLDQAPDEHRFRLVGDGVALGFAPTLAAVESRDEEGRLARRDQLCEVTGQIRIDGGEVDVSCQGWCSDAEPDVELRQLDSFRFVAGWPDRQDGFSLMALRPRKAQGQESDIVAATLLEDPPPFRVVEARLSTTYTESGRPFRAGLELWLEQGDDEDSEGAGATQYPRRAAGELSGPDLEWSHQGLALQAALLHWHSHGTDGPGVYVLGQRQ